MGNQSVWHIPLQGGKVERAIINTVNFLVDIVYDTFVKPNNEKLETNVNDTNTLKMESVDTYESLLDTQFELENAKDEIVEQYEAQLDLEFRVSQLEDSMEV